VLRVTAKNPMRNGLSFASVVGVEPVGTDAVEIKLSEPNFFLVSDLSGVLVTEPAHSENGTGPFRLVSQADQGASLDAFERYYRGRPGVSGIDITNYPTQRKAWTALMRGEIDMLHEVSRDAAEFVESETTVRTYSFTRPYYIPLVFNLRHPILQRLDVRKAINQALDKAALVRDGMNKKGLPADGPIFPQHWAYTPPANPFVFDPAAARERLENAGLKVHTQRDGASTARFSFNCLMYGDDPRFERLAVLVQKQLADVGVDMRLEPVPEEALGRRLGSGEFDAFLFEMAGRSLGRVYEFWRSHEGGLINSGYRSADGVLDRIKHARSDDEVKAAVAELERILHDDPPAAFLAWQETSRAVSTKFDVSPEENRDILANVWQWRPVAAPGKQASR